MMGLLPVQPAHELISTPSTGTWLIEGLWAEQAVGIVGGEPKCCKSFLALDMAVAVASGARCLRQYRPARTGRVLLFAAEDAPHVVRLRLEGICAAAGVSLPGCDIQVITVPTLRIDLSTDQKRLADTVAALRPVLLLLDPFVRLHRIDENVSSEVAPVLAYLRELQRLYSLSVVLVHHARKGAAKQRAGQALRGSSEFHAWGDSNLYIRRAGDRLSLTIEHRAAPGTAEIPLRLAEANGALALEASGESHSPAAASIPGAAAAAAPPLSERIETALAEAPAPLSLPELRRSCRIRTERLCQALAALNTQGRIVKSSAGYQLAQPFPVSLSRHPLENTGNGNGK